MAKHFDLNPFDESYMLYGNYIGAVYVFEHKLDEYALAEAWKILQKQFPPLASRYDRRSQCLAALAKPIEVEFRSEPSRFSNHVNDTDFDILRTFFVEEPDRKMAESGQAPMSTLTLTDITEGGSILGFAVAHCVTDAGGFHRLARQLADNYNAIRAGENIPDADFLRSLPEFNFGTDRSWEQTKEELTRMNITPPVSLKGFSGWFMRRLITFGMKHIMSIERYPVHFTPEQVTQLKATILEESGEDWISTNVALCAHFSSIMAELMHGNKTGKTVQLGQLLDLRNRYFEDPDNLQDRFIGNAILIHSEITQLEDFSRGTLARFFKEMTTGLNPNFIKRRMDVISDCFRHGRTYPGLEMKTPIICVNNQTKMPVYDLNFEGTTPSRILPQDVGDNIMFFPASDGGVEIYLRAFHSKDSHEGLKTSKWQDRIFDF